jgi:hypothetical protein
LPRPFERRVRVLGPERTGQGDATAASREVRFVLRFRAAGDPPMAPSC